MRLGDLITVKVGNENADFWVIRRGSINTLGNSTHQYNPEHFGITVKRTDVLLPEYAFYMFQHLCASGYFKPKARGVLELKNILASDITNIELGEPK